MRILLQDDGLKTISQIIQIEQVEKPLLFSITRLWLKEMIAY